MDSIEDWKNLANFTTEADEDSVGDDGMLRLFQTAFLLTSQSSNIDPKSLNHSPPP